MVRNFQVFLRVYHVQYPPPFKLLSVTHVLLHVRTFRGRSCSFRGGLTERDRRRARDSNPDLQFTAALTSAP